MATVKKNPVIEGLSGGVGKLVFKQYGDKTVVCAWPEHGVGQCGGENSCEW